MIHWLQGVRRRLQTLYIRKVTKVNHSYYVIVPKSYLRALRLRRNDYVTLHLQDDKIIIQKLPHHMLYREPTEGSEEAVCTT